MALLEQLAWLEATTPSTWARESGAAFFAALTAHSLALAVVVGIQLAFHLRLLGAARGVSLTAMMRFAPIMWCGVIVVVLSGSILLLAYPAKALTNPVFFVKLGCVATALLLYHYFILKRITADQGGLEGGRNDFRLVAVLCLFLWLGSLVAGRFLAYTNTVLLASDYF